MAPDFDLRLRTMAAALRDIVLPALPAGEKMAVEQAQLVIGSIEMIRAQIDYGHAYEVTDAGALIALVARLEDLLGSNGADLAAARTLIAKPVCSTASVRQLNITLRSAACRLVEASAGSDETVRAAVRRAVLDHEKAQIMRERSWVAATGFDIRPQDVSSIPQALQLERGEPE